MPRPLALVLIVVLAFVMAAFGLALPGPSRSAQALQGPPSGNDAGSGTDAGNGPTLALALSDEPRTWTANLTPTGTDSDWYRLATSGAFCAIAETTTSSPGHLTLASSETLDASAQRSSDPHTALRLALAAPAGRAPFLGVEPASVARLAGEGSGPPNPGRYTFTLQSRSYADLDPEGDGESPEAGSTSATSVALPADCAAGRIGADPADTADRYHLDVNAPREITFSFAIAAGSAAQARIVSPSGTTHATLQDGNAVTVWADEEGRWAVIVEFPPGDGAALPLGLVATTFSRTANAVLSDSSYIIGTSDGPDPEPCRPTC